MNITKDFEQSFANKDGSKPLCYAEQVINWWVRLLATGDRKMWVIYDEVGFPFYKITQLEYTAHNSSNIETLKCCVEAPTRRCTYLSMFTIEYLDNGVSIRVDGTYRLDEQSHFSENSVFIPKMSTDDTIVPRLNELRDIIKTYKQYSAVN